MKKFLLLLLLIPFITGCQNQNVSIDNKNDIFSNATIISTEEKDYWLYIRTYDKPELTLGETGGRSKKGDIVQVIPCSQSINGKEEIQTNGEWLIVKVSGLTKSQIDLMMQPWQEQTGVNEDGSPIEKTKAYRKYKIDIDNLKNQEGINISEGLWDKKIDKTDIINQIELKDKKDISRYYWQSVRYSIVKNITKPVLKLANLIIPKARAATTNNYYVNPGADAGGNGTTSALTGANCAFQSLNLWEDARNGDLVTLDTIEIANCAGTTADTTAVNITGWTTGADNYISIIGDYICPASGSMYSTSYYRLEISNNYALYITEQYSKISRIQITVSGTWNRANLYYGDLTPGQAHTVDQCIFKLTNTGTSQCVTSNDSDVVSTIRNSIFIGNTTGVTTAITHTTNGGNFTVYNCTISGFDFGIENKKAADTTTAKNCAVLNNGDDFLQTAGTLAIDYCASDDGDGTNAVDWANEATDWANVFVDYANGDFHLNNFTGTGKIIDMGTDLSANFTTDIDGDTRTGTWDIGADEYISTGVIAPNGNLQIKSGELYLKEGELQIK